VIEGEAEGLWGRVMGDNHRRRYRLRIDRRYNIGNEQNDRGYREKRRKQGFRRIIN